MARASNAEWTNWIESARARDVFDVAVEYGAHLKRQGHEWVGPCPICGGTDRFAVNQQKRVFNCRGSGDEHGKGDSIDLVMHICGCDFHEAVERLTGTPRPDRSRDESAEDRKRREAAHAARAAEYARREAEERAAMEAKASRDEARIADILKIAVPYYDSAHCKAYVHETRGLNPPRHLTGDLRFVHTLDYWGFGDNGSQEPMFLASVPALIAIIRDALGEVIGISQTYLDPKEPKKWKPTGSPRNSAKKIRGRKQGGMIRLGRPAETIAIAEGWENALAWYQLGLGPEDIMLAAAVDLGNLAGGATGWKAHKKLVDMDGRPRRIPNGLPDPKRPGLILPDGIKSVIILADVDSESYATTAQLHVAAKRFRAHDLSVDLAWPPAGLDFNSHLLREMGRQEEPVTVSPHAIEHPVGIESSDDFFKRVAWIFEEPLKSKFGALYLDQLDDPGPEHNWLMHGWLACNEVSVVAGASRSGKSFLALEIGLCVAEARPIFGFRVRHGAVIYQAGEGAVGAKKRLRAWRLHHGRTWTRETPFVLLQRPIDIYHSHDDVDSLIEEILAHAKVFADPLRLVIIDTLAMATPGADENSGRDMSMVLANVAKISEKCGCHVMLVHHLNAAGGKLRGHTSVYANVGQVILVERDPETGIRTVTLDKQKDDEDGKSLKFELMRVTIGVDEDHQPITSCICLPVGEKEAVRREEELKGFRLNKAQEVFMHSYFEAERRYGVPVPREMTLPPFVRSLASWEDVKRIYAEKSPSDALTPEQQTTADAALAEKRWRETLKKRIQRMREDLEALQILGIVRHDGTTYVYWTGKPLRAFPQTQPTPKPDSSEDEPVADIEF